MPKLPEWNLCIGGEEYSKGKRHWTTIGVGWNNEKSISLCIDFPTHILIGPDTKLILLPRKDHHDLGESE